MHNEPHPLAGKTVRLRDDFKGGVGDPAPGSEFRVEDYWDSPRVGGQSWGASTGNPACIKYAVRAGIFGLPEDDEVLYGKDQHGLGHLIHVSEIETAEVTAP